MPKVNGGTELKGTGGTTFEDDDLLGDITAKAKAKLSNSFFTHFYTSNESLDVADGDTTALYSKSFTTATYVS